MPVLHERAPLNRSRTRRASDFHEVTKTTCRFYPRFPSSPGFCPWAAANRSPRSMTLVPSLRTWACTFTCRRASQRQPLSSWPYITARDPRNSTLGNLASSRSPVNAASSLYSPTPSPAVAASMLPRQHVRVALLPKLLRVPDQLDLRKACTDTGVPSLDPRRWR